MDYEAAREIVYGMPYGEWKKQYQSEASESQKAEFAAAEAAKAAGSGSGGKAD